MSLKVVPGSLLQISSDVELGEGLYRRDGRVYASRVGTVILNDSLNGGKIASVSRNSVNPCNALIPSIDQIIIGTVTRLAARYIGIDISVIERPGMAPTTLEEPFKGTLRAQDIWPPADKDVPSQLYMAARPGDLLRARIIGIGDASSGFLLSTALDDGLGVVFALCAASGEPLVPISWNEMICSRTGIREPRKPAKPVPSSPTDN